MKGIVKFSIAVLLGAISYESSAKSETLSTVAVFADACLTQRGTANHDILTEKSKYVSSQLKNLIPQLLKEKNLQMSYYINPAICSFNGKSKSFGILSNTSAVNIDGAPIILDNNSSNNIDLTTLLSISQKAFQETHRQQGSVVKTISKIEKIDLALTDEQASTLKSTLGSPRLLTVQIYGHTPTASNRIGSIAASLITQGSSQISTKILYYVVSVIDLDQKKVIVSKSEKIKADLFSDKSALELKTILDDIL